MNNKSRVMGNSGFSLIELMIIVAIVSILAVALGFQFSGWIGSYNVESQTKNMYIDLMNARARAMGRNRAHFADFPTTTTYRIREDTNEDNAPLVVAGDTILPTYPKTVQYSINWTGTGTTITFDKNGIVSPFETNPANPPYSIWFTTTVTSDYDCLVVEATRLKMGKCKNADGTDANGTSCNNCAAK